MKKIIFLHGQKQLTQRDGVDYIFYYDIYENGIKIVDRYNIHVGISHPLILNWKTDLRNLFDIEAGDNLQKIMFAYGKEFVISRYKKNVLKKDEKLEMLTTTHSGCKFFKIDELVIPNISEFEIV